MSYLATKSFPLALVLSSLHPGAVRSQVTLKVECFDLANEKISFGESKPAITASSLGCRRICRWRDTPSLLVLLDQVSCWPSKLGNTSLVTSFLFQAVLCGLGISEFGISRSIRYFSSSTLPDFLSSFMLCGSPFSQYSFNGLLFWILGENFLQSHSQEQFCASLLLSIVRWNPF